MEKLEQIAGHAIVDMTRQMGKRNAQGFLREQFPELSPKDVRVLVEPDPLRRRQAVEKVVRELEREAEGKKRAQLNRLIGDRFPLISDPQRAELVRVFALPIPPVEPDPPDPPIYELIVQALEQTALQMEPGASESLLREKFTSLSASDARILVIPVVERQQALEKVVRQLADEMQQRNTAEQRQVVTGKLPTLPPAEVREIIDEVAHTKRKPAKKSR